MPTSAASGTQAATISTEHTLSTQAVAGTYVLVTDLSNLAANDVVELRLYTKNQSGKSSVLAYVASFANVQDAPQALSVPVPTDTEVKATLKQVAGTGRNFDWNLLKL